MPRLSKALALRLAGEAVCLLALAGIASGLAVWWRGGLPKKPVTGQIEVTLAEALRLNPLWIDARPVGAYEAGHIPGAVSLNLAEYREALSLVLERWEPNRPAVVYDDAPGEADSREVAARLADFKLGRVCVLKGGWKAWLEH